MQVKKREMSFEKICLQEYDFVIKTKVWNIKYIPAPQSHIIFLTRRELAVVKWLNVVKFCEFLNLLSCWPVFGMWAYKIFDLNICNDYHLVEIMIGFQRIRELCTLTSYLKIMVASTQVNIELKQERSVDIKFSLVILTLSLFLEFPFHSEVISPTAIMSQI